MDFKNKIIESQTRLLAICAIARIRRKKIVLTTGAYDIVHKGHVNYLAKARKSGDFLVVAINSDNFIKEIKGKDRPINKAYDRALVVAAFSFVDCVFVFDGEDSEGQIVERERNEIIRIVRPAIFVMSESSHSSPTERSGQQGLVRAFGGEILIFQEMAGIHTTEIIDKMGLRKSI